MAICCRLSGEKKRQKNVELRYEVHAIAYSLATSGAGQAKPRYPSLGAEMR
jgi:hypothetical protein